MRAEPAVAEEPAVVVSCDGHVGPVLETQLRPYCPQRHLRAFDEFVHRYRAQRERFLAAVEAARTDQRPDTDSNINVNQQIEAAAHPNLRTAGHHDVHARLRDMDRDGVTAEVIYQFSQNDEVMPFFDPNDGLAISPVDLELGPVGYQIYNRWLADFCSVEPQRLIGLAYVPLWDLDAAVKEVEWARAAGLRGVNFPPPGRSYLRPFNHPDWEPFWSVCAELGMSLNTHANGPPMTDYDAGPGARALFVIEAGGWLSRRGVWWLIHGEVFDRHPELQLVITEQFEGWWTPTARLLDSVARFDAGATGMAGPLAKMPSEYLRSNVYLGASMMTPAQAADAHREGYADRVIWGRDYPHQEGTFLYSDDPDDEPITRLSLRHALSGIPSTSARLMAGENAVALFGLDPVRVREIANQINAPTAAELGTPLTSLPEVPASSCAFTGPPSEWPTSE